MRGGQHYNFVVVGGGSAGYAAARTAREFVPRVAVVDGAATLGGLCILRGCMPSKTLLYSAEMAHLARHGAALGLDIPSARVDLAALQARKRRLIGEFAAYRQQQLADGRFDLLRARARFIGPRELALDNGATVTADHFLLATGSVVNWPDLPGLAQAGALTSDEVLELERAPESVIVLGGGVVACELAQFLARAGSRVTLVQRSPQLLRECCPAAADVLTQALRDEGMKIFTGTQVNLIERRGDGTVRVRFTHAGREIEREAAALFNALGRAPATADLGLAAADVALAPDGHVLTDAFQRTSNPAVYAAGDCAGPHEIVHVAILQGEVAARDACGQRATPVNYDHLVNIVFTDPQIATAGLTERELRARNIAFVSASYPFNDHGKSLVMDATRGYVKILAERGSGRLLGAECVGRDAAELIHAPAVALPLGATCRALLQAHWYHPTLSEIWTYPLEECAAAAETN